MGDVLFRGTPSSTTGRALEVSPSYCAALESPIAPVPAARLTAQATSAAGIKNLSVTARSSLHAVPGNCETVHYRRPGFCVIGLAG